MTREPSVDFGEGTTPHGCWLLDLGEGETRTTFLPIESRPFLTIDFDHEDPIAQIALSDRIGWAVEDAVVRVDGQPELFDIGYYVEQLDVLTAVAA